MAFGVRMAANLSNNIIADGWAKVLRDAVFFVVVFFSSSFWLDRTLSCQILFSFVCCCHRGLLSVFKLLSGVG